MRKKVASELPRQKPSERRSSSDVLAGHAAYTVTNEQNAYNERQSKSFRLRNPGLYLTSAN